MLNGGLGCCCRPPSLAAACLPAGGPARAGRLALREPPAVVVAAAGRAPIAPRPQRPSHRRRPFLKDLLAVTTEHSTVTLAWSGVVSTIAVLVAITDTSETLARFVTNHSTLDLRPDAVNTIRLLGGVPIEQAGETSRTSPRSRRDGRPGDPAARPSEARPRARGSADIPCWAATTAAMVGAGRSRAAIVPHL
jgi:hypothetical protein